MESGVIQSSMDMKLKYVMQKYHDFKILQSYSLITTNPNINLAKMLKFGLSSIKGFRLGAK